MFHYLIIPPFGIPVLPEVYSTMPILSTVAGASISLSVSRSPGNELASRVNSSKEIAGTPLFANIAGLAEKGEFTFFLRNFVLLTLSA